MVTRLRVLVRFSCAASGALLGVLFTTALGDLVESQVKRDLGIKALRRCHGGLMDRLDGFAFRGGGLDESSHHCLTGGDTGQVAVRVDVR